MSYVICIYICAYMLYLHVLIPFDYTQLLRVDDVMMKTSILEPENWSRPRLRYRSAISWWWRWSKMTKWQSLTKWQKYTNSCGFERFGTNEWCVRTVFFCLPEFWQYFPFYKTPRYAKLSAHLQSCNCCNYPKLWNRMPLVLALLALRLVVFHCDRLSFGFSNLQMKSSLLKSERKELTARGKPQFASSGVWVYRKSEFFCVFLPIVVQFSSNFYGFIGFIGLIL